MIEWLVALAMNGILVLYGFWLSRIGCETIRKRIGIGILFALGWLLIGVITALLFFGSCAFIGKHEPEPICNSLVLLIPLLPLTGGGSTSNYNLGLVVSFTFALALSIIGVYLVSYFSQFPRRRKRDPRGMG